MIKLTKLNNEKFLLNSALIEVIEFIPETKVILSNGHFYIVKESEEDLIDKIFEYSHKVEQARQNFKKIMQEKG